MRILNLKLKFEDHKVAFGCGMIVGAGIFISLNYIITAIARFLSV